MRARRSFILFTGAWVALAALYFLALGAVRTTGMLALPYQAEYGEGPVLDWARQIANGTLPYKPIDTPPYNFSVYTPLYLALSGFFLALFPDNPYFGGRLISLLSALGLGLLIWVGGRSSIPRENRLTAGWGKAQPLLAILLWLVSPYVFRWGTYLRPDMLALFWSGLGMVLLTLQGERGKEKGETARLLLVALCFVLAFFTKQSFFAAPIAALLYLLLNKRYTQVVQLGVAGALMGGVVGGGLYALSGNALLENLIAANANPFSWEAVWRFWWSFITIAPLLMVGALVALRHRQNWLWGLYLLIAVGVSISIGKAGAWENYFLEPLWIMCLLVGIPQAEPTQEWKKSTDWLQYIESSVGIRLILVLVQLFLFRQGYERLGIQEEQTWLAGVRAEGEALRAAVAALPPDLPIYSEQMGVLAELGRPVLLHSFVYTQLARQGLSNENAITSAFYVGRGGQAIVIQRFDAVNDPLKTDRWSRGMLDTIEETYGLGQPVGEWLIRYAGDDNRFFQSPVPVPLDNGITLLNSEAETCTAEGDCRWGMRPVELFPNGMVRVQSLWQSADEIESPLSISLKLFDANGQFITQKDGAFRNGWMGRSWAAGATLRDEGQFLELPATLPRGAYSVEVTLYESESGAPLATTRLPYFKVRPAPVPAPEVGGLNHLFANNFILQGHSSLPATLQAGETLTVDFTYQSLGGGAEPLTTFLQLLAPDGTLAAQSDIVPTYPPSVWSKDERVLVSNTLALPATLATGEYRLVTGWYNSNTLVRLPLENGSDFVDIGTVLIVE